MTLAPLLLAWPLWSCTPANDDTGDSIGDACPALDCRDRLTLTVLAPTGQPEDTFSGTVTAGTESLTFSCPSDADSFPGGFCDETGVVALYIYGETITVDVYAGEDAPFFNGDLTPTWDAPYDSDECGHYCYLAEETVTLEPCDGCG